MLMKQTIITGEHVKHKKMQINCNKIRVKIDSIFTSGLWKRYTPLQNHHQLTSWIYKKQQKNMQFPPHTKSTMYPKELEV